MHIVPPDIAFDLQQHTKWEEPAKYAGAKQIFRGELGRLYGARYVEHTNPWIEDGAAGRKTPTRPPVISSASSPWATRPWAPSICPVEIRLTSRP